MKSARITIALGVVALIVAGVVLTQTGGRDGPTAITGVLDVDQLATNPSTFAGQEICLRGIVSAVQPEQQLFAVIDHAEYAACKVVTCSQYQIPITYAGDLPDVEASVIATGHLTQPEPGRYLFQATALELKP
jgi:cytochrome c-type biogenesis protein CcmE